jgi:hypothetical protein
MDRRQALRALGAAAAVPAVMGLTAGTAHAGLLGLGTGDGSLGNPLGALGNPLGGLTGSQAQGGGASAQGDMGIAKGTGAGMYVDMSTAQQMSTFTIDPNLVTCGVGTFGIGQLALSGPFSMLMYSTRIDSYEIDGNTIKAKGRMRSITMIAAGLVTENVEHDFLAIASGGGPGGGGRFDVHFVTPFWTPGLMQPMATPSGVVGGWARFGGNVATNLVDKTPLGGVNP